MKQIKLPCRSRDIVKCNFGYFRNVGKEISDKETAKTDKLCVNLHHSIFIFTYLY